MRVVFSLLGVVSVWAFSTSVSWAAEPGQGYVAGWVDARGGCRAAMSALDRNYQVSVFLDKLSADWTAEDLRDYAAVYGKCIHQRQRQYSGSSIYEEVSHEHLREGVKQARWFFEHSVKPAIGERESRLATEESARRFTEEQERVKIAAAEREKRAQEAMAAQQAKDDAVKVARVKEQAELARRVAEDQHRAKIAAAEREKRAQEEAAAQQAKDDETAAARAREQAELNEARQKSMVEQTRRHAEAEEKLAAELTRQAEAEEAALTEARAIAEKAAAARRAAEQRLARVRSEAQALKAVPEASAAPVVRSEPESSSSPKSMAPIRVDANAEPPVPPVSASSMSLDDFRLDYDKLRDRPVKLTGTLRMQGEMLVLMPGLYKGIMNTDFIFLDWEHLPRDQRKQLMDRCRDLGCSATVRGRAADVLFNKGLRVETVSLN